MRRTASRLLALLVGPMVAGCTPDAGPAGEATAAVAVEFAQAVVRDYAVTFTALGQVTSRPGGTARISAPGESVVTAVRVGPGDIVAIGDPLVELDRSVWREQALEAESSLSAADEAYARADRLVARGILPTKDLEAAATEQARARAAVAEARRTLDRAVLRSPIPGVVSSVSASLAQPVTASDVLAVVTDTKRLDALVRLTPAIAAEVSPGDSVELFTGLDPASESLGHGVVRGLSSEVDAMTGTVVARVAMTDLPRPVRVGLPVWARIVVARHDGAVVVPRTAIVPVTEGFVVFVVDASDVAHATSIELGAADGDSVEVVSGLSGSERVVAGGAYGVVDGVHVRPAGRP